MPLYEYRRNATNPVPVREDVVRGTQPVLRRIAALLKQGGKGGDRPWDSIADVVRIGADIIVTGSGVFYGKAPLEKVRFIMSAIGK